jgi:hypothetical protein
MTIALGTHPWVYTIKGKSDVFDVLKKFYADTAVIRCKHPLCCFRRDNAGENFSAAAVKSMTSNGIQSSSSSKRGLCTRLGRMVEQEYELEYNATLLKQI